MISLESVSKKTKSKLGANKVVLPIQNPKGISLLNPQQHGQSRNNHITSSETTDERSESSASSQQESMGSTNSGTSSFQIESLAYSRGTSGFYRRDSVKSDDSGAITAMIEPSYSGCLPGDLLPLKVSVDHTKPVKMMQGIIVTLYRQGRVDTSPTLPLGPSVKGQKQGYEYYPKSITGLGGLSLSSAGSSRLFRQDLNQTFTPLIIDPRSLTAVVKTSIQVPENVFPSITSTPGAMISFRYYLEVVIDLRGKPVSQDRLLPRLSMVNAGPSYGQGETTIRGVDGITSSASSSFCSLDTSQTRREKGVVSTVFEVVVGTRDSNRRRLRQKEHVPISDNLHFDAPSGFESAGNGDLKLEENPQNFTVAGEQAGNRSLPAENYEGSVPHITYSDLRVILPPTIENDMDEKTRLKRAEERLLPSAPPGDDEPSPSALTYPQPSAPTAFEEFDHDQRQDHEQLGVLEYGEASAYAFETRAQNTSSWPRHQYQSSNPTSSAVGPHDDKQELEHQRLQMAASSPDDIPDGDMFGQDTQQTRCLEPTAPALDGDHPYQYYGALESNTSSEQAERVVSNEHLPVYRK